MKNRALNVFKGRSWVQLLPNKSEFTSADRILLLLGLVWWENAVRL